MKFFPNTEGGTFNRPGHGNNRVGVRDTSLLDAPIACHLARRNATMLDERFPGVTDRYRNWLSSFMAIERTRQSPNRAGLTITEKFGFYSRTEKVIGRASVIIGQVSCQKEVVIPKGVNIALWLRGDYRNLGIGGGVVSLLAEAVPHMPVSNAARLPIFTLIDPDNAPSIAMAQRVGFEEHPHSLDPSGPYVFDGGEYDSVLFVLPKSAEPPA